MFEVFMNRTNRVNSVAVRIELDISTVAYCNMPCHEFNWLLTSLNQRLLLCQLIWFEFIILWVDCVVVAVRLNLLLTVRLRFSGSTESFLCESWLDIICWWRRNNWLGSGLRDHLWDESVWSLAKQLFKPYLIVIPLESLFASCLDSTAHPRTWHRRIRVSDCELFWNLESVEWWFLILKFASGGF